MFMHNCDYVATASLAFMEDYYAKLDKAIEAAKKGMAYIHVFSPCPTGWQYDPSMLVQVARKAVEANIFPLWEFENEKGRIVFTHSVYNPLPMKAYLSLIGKFRHLDEGQITFQENTERKIAMLKYLTGEKKEEKAHAA